MSQVMQDVLARLRAAPPCEEFATPPATVAIPLCCRCSQTIDAHLLRQLIEHYAAQSLAHETLAKTTLTPAEWQRAVGWRDRWLEAEPGAVAPLAEQTVAYLVADGETFRALAQAVTAARIDPLEITA